MTKRMMLAAALLLAVTAAEAQQLPPGQWWRRAEVVRELGLTTEQQQRLDDVFRAAANELIDAKASVEKRQVALRGAIDRPQLRRDEIRAIAAQLSAARAALFERELMMLVDMREVLTESQWNRLRTRLDRMRERGEGARRPTQRDRPPGGRRP